MAAQATNQNHNHAMEIKLLCACGTKFKFDVEPVHGRMPAPVHCPVCGVEATDQANDILREKGAPQPAAPGIASAPSPGGLRIHRAQSASESSAESAPPRMAPPPAPIRVNRSEPAPRKSKNQLVTILTTIVLVGACALGAWKIGMKWYRGIKAVADVASAIGDASAGNTAAVNSNFDYVDSVVLFVKHTNHLEVGEACKAYWKEKWHKNLTLTEGGEMAQVGDYQLIAEHNGYVRIFGTLEWPASQYEAVSQHLSQKFNTLVFEVSDSDFSGAFHFGVYEQGTRKFHAQTEFKRVGGEMEESVKTENKDWAIAHGYKPGEDGFNDFYLDDADEITQKMGMKFWDEPEGKEIKGMLMHETP